MTDERWAQAVEAAARAIHGTTMQADAVPFHDALSVYQSHTRDMARAALSAAAPFLCEECAREPVSSVVPITRLRAWIDDREVLFAPPTNAFEDGQTRALNALADLLDDVECASNPNNERTNNA
jgi:ADP-ribose pyrophosphatase YjhB (NUDIX family)